MTEFVKEQLKDQILQNLFRDNSTSLKLTKMCSEQQPGHRV